MPKTAVLVIDMQKDFTRPEGRFYYPETTGEMMKTFPEKLNKMRDLGALVVIVYTAHPADEKEVNPELTRMFRDGKKASLVEGSAGAELEERIPYDPERDIMFRKFVPSAFFGTNLAEILRERGVENVLVCGVKTNVCCRDRCISLPLPHLYDQRHAWYEYQGDQRFPSGGNDQILCKGHQLRRGL